MAGRKEKVIQIGLDIGSESIKAVAVSHSEAKPQLLNFSIRPIKDNIIKAVKDTHSDLGITKRSVVTSVAGPTVIVRYVEMPSMTEEELKNASRFEAEKVIPYNINEVFLDSAKVEDLGKNRMRVVIVAAKKGLVNTQIKMIREADLEPLILDIDSFAVMSAFINAGIDKENVCGLINIGAKTSNLNIMKGKASYLSRDIDIGGNAITRAIAENLSLSEADAERVKKEKLSNLDQLESGEKKKIKKALDDVLLRLADEARLSFDFYENHYVGNVDKVYISGGASGPKEVVEFLKEALGRDTLQWDVLSNMDIDEKIDRKRLNEAQPQLAVAVGLGLRGVE